MLGDAEILGDGFVGFMEVTGTSKRRIRRNWLNTKN